MGRTPLGTGSQEGCCDGHAAAPGPATESRGHSAGFAPQGILWVGVVRECKSPSLLEPTGRAPGESWEGAGIRQEAGGHPAVVRGVAQVPAD